MTRTGQAPAPEPALTNWPPLKATTARQSGPGVNSAIFHATTRDDGQPSSPRASGRSTASRAIAGPATSTAKAASASGLPSDPTEPSSRTDSRPRPHPPHLPHPASARLVRTGDGPKTRDHEVDMIDRKGVAGVGYELRPAARAKSASSSGSRFHPPTTRSTSSKLRAWPDSSVTRLTSRCSPAAIS